MVAKINRPTEDRLFIYETLHKCLLVLRESAVNLQNMAVFQHPKLPTYFVQNSMHYILEIFVFRPMRFLIAYSYTVSILNMYETSKNRPTRRILKHARIYHST
jgi:hypothetical protein